MSKLLTKNLFLAALIFFTSLAVYFFTLVPGVYEGDSGELITAIHTMGVAHPTGFPLLMILGKLWTLIFSFGEIAFRLNLFSALFASLTAGLLFTILKNLSLSRLVSFTGALIFAFSSTLWSHATTLRVYSLAAFFIALIIYLAIKWQQNQFQNKYLYLIALSSGLGLATHLSFVLAPLFAAIFILLALCGNREIYKKIFNLKFGLIFLILLLAGLSIYLYIPIRSQANPPINWDEPSTFQNFIHYITQRDYAGKIASRNLENSFAMLALSFKLFFFEFTAVGLFLALWGLIKNFNRQKQLFIGLMALVLGNILLMFLYGNSQDLTILYRYFMPAYLALAVFIAFGLKELAELLQKIKLPLKLKQFSALSLILIFPLLNFGFHFHQNDRHKNFIVENYSKNILNSIPAQTKTILFTVGDAATGPIMYLQNALGKNLDVINLDKELLKFDFYVGQMNRRFPSKISKAVLAARPEERFLAIISENINKIPIFAAFNNDLAIKTKFKYLPYGLIFRIVPKQEPEDINKIVGQNDELWQNYDFSSLLNSKIYTKDFLVEEIAKQYSNALVNLSAYYFNNSLYEDGEKNLKLALNFEPNNFKALYNLYRTYLEKGDKKLADEYLEKAKKTNPAFFKDDASAKMTNAQDFYQLGIHYGLEKKYQLAVTQFEKAIKLDPNFDMVYFNLANIYGLTKEYQKATIYFEKALEINPNLKIVYLNLGDIYANYSSDKKKAIEYLKKYLELEPQTPLKNDVLKLISKLKK